MSLRRPLTVLFVLNLGFVACTSGGGEGSASSGGVAGAIQGASAATGGASANVSGAQNGGDSPSGGAAAGSSASGSSAGGDSASRGGATGGGAAAGNGASGSPPDRPGTGGSCAMGAPALSPRLPAFPGAQGFGAFAKGGRSGDVYHVINLAASGAGSLAYGIENTPATGRTIVFDVSGYASISGTLRVTKPNLTIAGQTAPGDGFGLKDGTFLVSAADVVVRHLRFRDGNSADSLDLDENADNTMWDHCDMLFSHDENMSSFKAPPDNLSFQYSINAWGLETHSAGGLWDMLHVTSHHSLWAHNHTRNPKARALLLDWVNNVTFDWDIGFIMGDSDTPADWRSNLRGSYFLAGTSKTNALESANLDRNGKPNFSIFMEDCVLDGNVNGVVDSTRTNYEMASGDYTKLAAAVPLTANLQPVTASNPVLGVPVTQDDALTAYKKVISSVGPLRLDVDPKKPLRDEIDTILINDVITQNHRHLTYQQLEANGATNGGFGTLTSTPAPLDTDHDGMPDYWEEAVGLNARSDDHLSPVAACGFAYAAGYTALEDYLQWLAIPHGVVLQSGAAAAGALDVDLRKFTSGLKTGAVFSVTAPVQGTVTLAPDGYTAHFVPSPSALGRAGFSCSGTDSDKSTIGFDVGVLIAKTLPR